MYEKEVVDQEAKIEKMKADKKDEYDIKKQVRYMQPFSSSCSITCVATKYLQVEVLQESKNMVPDCQRRLEAAYSDLKTAIVS